MAFPKNFEPDTGGNSRYVMSNLKSGEKVKVRVLGDWITGNVVWSDNPRKPNRFKPGQDIPAEFIGTSRFTGEPERIKQFIAAPVYNYKTKRLEVLEIDKSKLIAQIYELESNEDWGDPIGYDITISKSGTGTDTTYSAIPSGKGKFLEKVDVSKVNVEALFGGGDPFSTVVVDEGTTNEVEAVSEDVPF